MVAWEKKTPNLFILVSQPPGRGGVNPVGTKYQVFFSKKLPLGAPLRCKVISKQFPLSVGGSVTNSNMMISYILALPALYLGWYWGCCYKDSTSTRGGTSGGTRGSTGGDTGMVF